MLLLTRRFLLTALLALPLVGADARLDWVDAYVERAMKQFHAPGAAVGVMVDGEVLLAKGYGLRSSRDTLPVTADTVFATGSISKSFTALAAGILVDEKKLDWDRPVKQYLPWFQLHDPVATELINMRDLLTHRSGLPRYDSMRFMVHFPREELIRRLRYLPPSKTFRDGYQYNNLMYVTAGYVAGVVADSTWEDLVSQRIFEPLGMKSSSVRVTDMQKGMDFALPHRLVDGAAKPVEFYDYQGFGVGPNGAVNSSVNDLLRYLRFFLEGGTVGGKRLVSESTMRELWKPVTVVNERASYALGWQISMAGDHRIVAHGGAITGFTAHAAMAPEKRIAVVALNNIDSPLPRLVCEEILDRLLARASGDRIARHLADVAARRPASHMSPAATNGLTRPLDAFAGKYTHPAYGPVAIRTNGDLLEIVFPDFVSTLAHREDGIFLLSGDPVTFEFDSTGNAARVLLPMESAVPPLPFVRVTE